MLGHGSGFDSPGWNALRHVFPRLGQAFHTDAPRCRALRSPTLYVQGREHEHLYRLAEALIELDEQAQHWRLRHYQVVARVIGDKVVGTQGTPVELLGRLVSKTSFPELWEVRNELTALSKDGVRLSLTSTSARGGHRAPAGAAPHRHGQSAGERDGRRRVLRDYLARERDRVRALRARAATARTSSRASRAATGRRSRSSPTRTRSSPIRPSGIATRGPATSSTARCGGAARST